MAKSKKELEAELIIIKQENENLKENLANLVNEESEEVVEINYAELLSISEQFVDAVKELINADRRFNANKDSQIAVRDFDKARKKVNTHLLMLSKVVA